MLNKNKKKTFVNKMTFKFDASNISERIFMHSHFNIIFIYTSDLLRKC